MNAMTQIKPSSKIIIRTAEAGQKTKGLVFWHYPDSGFIDMVKHLSQGNFDKNWAFSPEDADLFKSLLQAAAQSKVDDFVALLPEGVFAVRFPLFISDRKDFKSFADALVDAGVGWGTETSGQLQDASSMLAASEFKKLAKPQSGCLAMPKPETPARPQGKRNGICIVNYGGQIAMPAVTAAAARDDLKLDNPTLWSKVQKNLEFLLAVAKSEASTGAAKKAAVSNFVVTLHDAGVVRVILPYQESWWQFEAVSAVLERYAPAWLKVMPNERTYTPVRSKCAPEGGAAKKAATFARKKERAAKDAAQRLAMRGKTGQKDQPKQRKKK